MSTGYNQGTDVILSALFTADGDPADPTTVTFQVRYPDTTVVSYLYGTDPEVVKTGIGAYQCDVGIPPQTGEYRYDAVGTGLVESTLPGTFYVFQNVTGGPESPPPGPFFGPVVTWITGGDVANCCGVDYGGNTSVLDAVAFEASMALYQISGRQFPAVQNAHVRPCNQACGCSWTSGLGVWWGMPAGYGGGYAWGGGGFGGWGWWNENGTQFGCQPLSRVKLAGYPIRQINQVTIGGEILDPACYRLDEWRYLTRMALPGPPVVDAWWPSCQNMALNDDQPGTFSVDYQWGSDPPPIGRDAACQLACQLFMACGGDAADCLLPAGTTRVERQGITVERGLLTNWLNPAEPTGLVVLDTFLRAYVRNNAKMRSAIYSPDVQAYSRPFANTAGDAACYSTLGSNDFGV